MKNENFWNIIKEFNSLMKSAIMGPNCIDPSICKGDCCSIKIDVPKILAQEYLRRGYAKKTDFIRSDIFTFQLRFDEKKGKCFLFDNEINGCKVHESGIKPPQCWIYPTGFSNPEHENIRCKRAGGWKIINSEKAQKAEKLLEKYNFLCQLEAKKEIRQLKRRMGSAKSKIGMSKRQELEKKIRNTAPSELGGFRDTWDKIDILSAEGLSLQMKKFCQKYKKDCQYLKTDFFECRKICEKIAHRLVEFLYTNLQEFIKKNGPDPEGHYSLIELFAFTKNKDYPILT
ncbi:MAG: YkgJ family cysteine cluster protein [Promethearchaeota archaeon]|nr:MAG: YkgJ family cysteine cluster protein [Candidatus Lokiarchaeota archaeon]